MGEQKHFKAFFSIFKVTNAFAQFEENIHLQALNLLMVAYLF